jgi:hypothetical protein
MTEPLNSMIQKTLAAIIAAVAILTTGCATVKDPAFSYALVEDAAAIGTIAVLAKHPELRPQFERAEKSLSGVIESGKFDGGTFREIVSALPVKELKSNDARLIITFAELQFRRHGQSLAIDQNEHVRSGMIAMRNGLRAALQ